MLQASLPGNGTGVLDLESALENSHQGRLARQPQRRAHLGLQVGMLSEQELTTILQMLQKLSPHMGVNVDSSKQAVQSFSGTTDVSNLASGVAQRGEPQKNKPKGKGQM
jgi:uncharacterized membrane protein